MNLVRKVKPKMKKPISVSWLGRLKSAKTAFVKYAQWKRMARFFQSYTGTIKESRKQWLEDQALTPRE